jgi:small-conductance mechanosensitive channel
MSALIRALLILSLLLGGNASYAAESDPPAAGATPALTTAQTLDQLGDQLDTIKDALKAKSQDAPLADLRSSALGVQDQSRQLAASLAPQMTALQAQLAVLGPAPAKGAPAEPAEVGMQRRQLDKAQAALDAQIKQAQLLSQNASQLAAQITGLRNDKFQARLASRTATPFSHTFWATQANAWPDDLVRVTRLGARWGDAWHDALQPPNRQPLLWCLIAAVALLLGGHRLLEGLLLRAASRHFPEGHLRRSAMAAAIALSAVLTTGLAAQLVHTGLNWNELLDADLDALASATVRLVYFSAFVAGLGRALLSIKHPSWRLPGLADIAARRLGPFPWLLGASALLFGLIERISRTVGSSLAVTVATHGVIALVISGLIGTALLRLRHAQRAAAAGNPPAPRQLWVGLLAASALLGVGVSWLGVVTGFIALGYFVALQMLWIGVVIGSLYVLTHLAHDLFEALLSPRGRGGQRLQATFDLSPNALDQTATVLSGISRIALTLLALTTVLEPFGAGPGDLWAGAVQTLGGGAKLGDLTITPGTILNGLLMFVVGLFVLRTLKSWLREQLLPKTTMQPGMQESLATLLGYLGGILLLVLTLAAFKVDLKSIAWIVSALSVGIGFGLQAVVQNFISGLILLIERPVKVGDWVSLDNVEGDIRRINVRATEIQMADRSTMIVPNSQLITENVRNVTLANAQGRVLINLPMPLDTDANKARSLILDALNEHPDTLTTPAPVVLLANLDAGSMTFNCIAYVNGPRKVGEVKSDLLFTILERLRTAELPLVRAQNMLVRNLPPLVDSPDGHG